MQPVPWGDCGIFFKWVGLFLAVAVRRRGLGESRRRRRRCGVLRRNERTTCWDSTHKVRHVDPKRVGHVRERQAPDHVGPDRLHAVRLAPVDVGPARQPCRVEHVGGLDALDVREHGRAVLEARRGVLEGGALLLEDVADEAADPARAAEDQEDLRFWLVEGRLRGGRRCEGVRRVRARRGAVRALVGREQAARGLARAQGTRAMVHPMRATP